MTASPSHEENTGGRQAGKTPAESSIAWPGSVSGAVMDSGWLPAPLADDVVDLATDHIQDFSLFPDFYMGDFGDSMAPGGVDLQGSAVFSTDLGGALRGNLPSPDTASSNTNPDMEDSVEFHTPRILDPVDNRPICAALRVQLDEMANSSSMVRCAMTAFAALQSRPKGSNPEYYRKYYDEASAELSNKFHQRGEKNILTNCGELGCVLTTVFFLTYINVS